MTVTMKRPEPVDDARLTIALGHLDILPDKDAMHRLKEEWQAHDQAERMKDFEAHIVEALEAIARAISKAAAAGEDTVTITLPEHLQKWAGRHSSVLGDYLTQKGYPHSSRWNSQDEILHIEVTL